MPLVNNARKNELHAETDGRATIDSHADVRLTAENGSVDLELVLIIGTQGHIAVLARRSQLGQNVAGQRAVFTQQRAGRCGGHLSSNS